jgi:serine/threonine protein kinase
MWTNLEERPEHTEIVTFREPNGELRYVPEEALILIYLHNSERFPRVDSVYTHGILTAILMTPCVDPSHEAVSHIDEDHFNQFVTDGDRSYIRKRFPSFPAFCGKKLMSDTKQPLVNELQGNKIAAQFLQGIIELADMRIWHEDLSIFNYLIDQDLNVQLIDMGQVSFGLDNQRFQDEWDYMISFQEYQLRPERAIELEKYDTWRNSIRDDYCLSGLVLPHDRRQLVLWKYSVLVYGFLHGFWPWEDPRPDSVKWHCRFFGTYGEPVYPAVKSRRKRMINEDVQISESLSQDCSDFLQTTLSRSPDDRPSLQEMSSFPWFSQWSAEELESGRPLKRPFVADFHNEQQGYGREGVPWPSGESAIAPDASSDDEFYSCFEELPISQKP